MFCTICNLHFPDNLNFCRRCGRALVHSTAEMVVESVHCTKCGTKATRFDQFCTLCDNQVDLKNEETVIGACRNCGTSWRSTWFFCKTCGLEREDGLQSPLSIQFNRRPTGGYVREEKNSGNVSYQEDDSTFLAYAQSQSPPPQAPPLAQMPNYMPVNSSMPTIIGPTPSEPLPKVIPAGNSQAEYSGRSNYSNPVFETDFARQPKYTTVVGSIKQTQNSSRRFQIPKVPVISLLLVVTVSVVAWLLFRSAPRVTRDITERPKPGLQAARPIPNNSQNNSVRPDIKPESITAPAGMIFIPSGKFLMGRSKGDYYDSPQIAVEIAPFYIDKTEVTNAEYKKFIDAVGKRAPSNWKYGRIPRGRENHPVVNVSWLDANAYAKWAGKRLPTEAEWEFAARGKDQRLYPWGNAWISNYANAGRGEEGSILAVGRFQSGKSPFGVLDMSGNVWEWTADDPISYADRSKKISTGKVVRGGAFNAPREVATTTYRGILVLEKGYDKTGFRCASNYIAR